MGYISESPGFGGYGCGSGCSCSGCRRHPALGEIYTHEKESEPTRSQTKSAPGSSVGECPHTFYGPRRLWSGLRAIRESFPFRKAAWISASLGDPPLSTRYQPWPVRMGLRVPSQHLRYFNLDQFNWSKASLTPRLLQMVRHLAEHVRVSWKSMRPIGFIRLIGHTDSTGQEQYNVDLGNRRAQAVKEALEKILQDDIIKGRIRIAISVEKSPGVKEPIANNQIPAGRALNRRVEVFVAAPMAAPPKPTPPPPPPPPPPPEPQPPYWTPIPPGRPGKSFKQWLDERLKWVPKLLRDKIWDALVGKDFSALSTLLNQAGISGAEKNAILESARRLGETPAR